MSQLKDINSWLLHCYKISGFKAGGSKLSVPPSERVTPFAKVQRTAYGGMLRSSRFTNRVE